VDPLLSTGFPLVLLGVTRLAQAMEDFWGTDRMSTALSRYAALTTGDLLATAKLVGALYASMDNFPLFTSLSLLYFATASFAETARRLQKPHLAGSFLLHSHPLFQEKFTELLNQASSVHRTDATELLTRDIMRAIEPFNIAGLGRADRRNWYGVDAEDLLREPSKLESNREEITRLLDRCGFCNDSRTAL
jgi:FADH2 O2-dependent halogenase